MDGLGGTFRTAAGEVSVDSDAVRIDKAPGAQLQSQAARWRHGGRWERYRAAARFCLLLLVPLLLLFRLVEPSGATTAASSTGVPGSPATRRSAPTASKTSTRFAR